MKLHWVELENWRQHTKTRIDFGEDTTVIYGPNEAGKSTVLEALSRGLFDRSSSQAEAIRRIKPLSSLGNVTSAVRIEFTLSKTRYRVEKNFNLRSGTSLYRIVDGKSTLLDQDTADERLIQLLEADLPSPRGSKPSQWGAFHWLWANQDNRELPDNKEGDPTTALHLEKEDTGMLVTPKFQAVQDMVQAAYARYFTRTGRISASSPIPGIEEEIQALQQRNVELSSKIEKVEGEKQKLEELQRQLPVYENKLTETKEELRKANNEAMDFSSIKSEMEASEARVNDAKRRVQDAKKALKALNESSKRIDKLQEDERKARGNVARLEAVCELLDKRLQEKVEEVEEKAMKIRECEELTRDARVLKDTSDTMGNIQELEKKINRIHDINGKIERLREKEAPIVPTSKEIDKLDQSETQIKVLKERLAVSGLTVDIAYGEKGSLEVEVDGEKIKGETTTTGTESVSVGALGLGKVTVTADLERARDAKSDILRLEKSIQGTLSKYAVSSIDELKELDRAQKGISASIKELVAEKRGIDERSSDEIDLELQKLKEKYEEYKKIERTPDAIKLNPAYGDLGELVNRREEEEDEARKVLDKARTERDEISEELTGKKEELAGLRAEEEHLSEELDNAITHQKEVVREYGSVENQEKILADAEADLNKQNQEYKRLEERYKELEKGPINKVKRLERQIENQEQIIRQQRTSINRIEGGISAESLEGAYSELAKTESDTEILSERLEREQIRAESFKLLKETLQAQYRSVLSAVVGPIQEEVKRSLAYVTGFLHEDVELNEYLSPTRLGERGIDDISLEFSDGSSGLKEILALCVRLAVAKHLSEKEPQCLILDDPFVHVSSDRSNRMIELVNEAIEEYGLQVIILTHRQMEFAGFAGKMVDIQSVK
jgi:DNA repair exonuclease SbcCD ATPase subunit